MKKAVIIFILIALKVAGQDSLRRRIPMPEIGGYLKYMEQLSFVENVDTSSLTSLLHNRINFKWAPGNFLFRLEARNRLFYGDLIKSNPAFMKSLEADPGAVGLSRVWLDKYSVGIHSIIDRALINYNNGNWDITLGRQRINWGLNMVWNPNDIFNTYNFFDFDYEERPGSDAVRVQYMWKGFSAMEVAVRKGKNNDDYTAALLYRSNKKNYDYQALAGISQKDLVAGIGWAGNIKDAGFKGEVSYFHNYEKLEDTSGVISASISGDYSFEKGWYVNISGYYNSEGREKINFLSTAQFFNVSAKQLLPFRYSAFLQVSKQINPLMTIGVSTIYSPTNNTSVVIPNIQFSVSENWDLTLLGQSYFAEVSNVYRSLNNSIFLRLKWNF